ncbi:MAG: hypothetical protein ACR2N1_09520 [Rubripirellula sp.]
MSRIKIQISLLVLVTLPAMLLAMSLLMISVQADYPRRSNEP